MLTNVCKTVLTQVSSSVIGEKARTEPLEREYLVRKTTKEMLPEADRYIAELQEMCGAKYVVVARGQVRYAGWLRNVRLTVCLP